MKNLIIVLLIFLSQQICNRCEAQDILQSTLVWNSSSNTNQRDNELTSYTCSFTTVTNQKITWSQGNSKVTNYTVVSVDGAWTDVTADGKVVYHISDKGTNAEITFFRTEGVAAIRMTFYLNGKVNFDYVFQIDSITAQP